MQLGNAVSHVRARVGVAPDNNNFFCCTSPDTTPLHEPSRGTLLMMALNFSYKDELMRELMAALLEKNELKEERGTV